jgi:hypothetical protein
MAKQSKGKKASLLQASASMKKRNAFAISATGTKNGSNPA